MADNFDIAMSEEEIRQLRSRIAQEISNVDTLLLKVAADCDVNGENNNDTILNGIKKTGEKMTKLWSETINAFKKSESLIDDAFDKAIKSAREALEGVEQIIVNH